MPETRTGLLLAVVLVVLAGCNAGPGDRTPEPIEVSASEATLSSEAVSAAGIAEAGVEEVQVGRSGTARWPKSWPGHRRPTRTLPTWSGCRTAP